MELAIANLSFLNLVLAIVQFRCQCLPGVSAALPLLSRLLSFRGVTLKPGFKILQRGIGNRNARAWGRRRCGGSVALPSEPIHEIGKRRAQVLAQGFVVRVGRDRDRTIRL